MSRQDKSRLNNMLAGRPGPAGPAATPGKGTNTENLEAGKPLDTSTRSVFEASLSTDLADVRVHDGEAAAAQAQDVDALAYAQGNDIFFAPGQYDPNNDEKRGLLAHEVAHVVQQKGAPADRNPNSTRAGDAAERDADQAAARMVHGAPATVASTPQQIAKKGPNDKKPTKIPLAQGVTAKFTKIQAGGKPTAAPDGKGGTITFTSPEVEFRGQFSVKSDKVEEVFGPADGEKYGNIEAGGIQNVLESERKAVYRRADGSVAGTQTMKTGQMHDQSTNPNDKPGGPATPYVDRDNSKTGGSKGKGGPWYTDSVTLEPTDQFKDNVLLVKDKPSQTLNLKVGDAVLDEISGHEKFVTTAAVQRGGETAPLVSEQWSIPWSMKLDKEHKGEGAEITHVASPDQHASVTDGKLPVNEKEWWSFESEAQALAAPRHMLLQSLKISKVKDPTSYGYAMSAIKKLNWSFEAQVNCVSKYSWIEKDQMELSVITNKTSVTKAMSIGKGESHALSFRFLDVYDPDTFNWDRPMIFMLTGEGHVLTFHCYAPFSEVTNANSGKDSGADHYSMKIFG